MEEPADFSHIIALSALLGATLGMLREKRVLSAGEIENLFNVVGRTINAPEMAMLDREKFSSVLDIAQTAATATTAASP